MTPQRGDFIGEDYLASYHFSAQIIGRSSGRSAVAAAAYRAGARLRDERNEREHDFSNRRGVAHTEILVPEGAAPWLSDRAKLWNHVERMEKRKDAQTCREINIALPSEIDFQERLALVRGFVQEQFVSKGMVADIAWHDPVAEKGDDPRNFHAHIMLTLRQATPAGLRPVKTREWNSDELMNAWRAAWAEHQNRALERAGHRSQVDHRSLETQRADAVRRGDRRAAEVLDRQPEIHIGPRARAAERRGGEFRSRTFERATARPVAGKWVSSRVPEKRSRMIDYGRIDVSTRVAFSAGRLRDNRRLVLPRLDKFERQAARLREREQRALRLIAAAGLPAHHPALKGLVLTPARLAAAERHRKRSRSLLQEIERILAELFHVRDLWGGRQQEILRVRPRGRGEGRSRG